MKHTALRLSRGLVMGLSLLFAAMPSATMLAQGWAKKAAKAVFTLKTFREDGTLNGSAAGFFTTEQGHALSSFEPFKGAYSAVVIDADGRELPVECLLGADDTYDVAKFRVTAKKTSALSISSTPAAVGATLWMLMPGKKLVTTPVTVRKAETFLDEYSYYTVAVTMPDEALSSPLLNEQGEVVGMMQKPANAGDSLSYAVSARLADSLRVNGLSINDPTFRTTHIRVALPDTEDQALLTLYLAGSSPDTLRYAALVDEFIAAFPQSPDGYVYRAQLLTGQRQFAAAAADMERALATGTRQDETHANYAKLIYHQQLYLPDSTFTQWSLARALDEAQQAERINPLPLYRRQQAVVYYAMERYDEAADIYATLFSTDLRSAELFYEASRCAAMKSDTTATLALLDSCVATFSKPYLKEAAPYIMARARVRLDAGMYRPAVSDLNDYEQLMPTEVYDNFFYLRHRAEVGGRLFQQALNDIDRAIAINPSYDLYYAEKASLQVRVALFDDAIATAKECIRLAPDYSDGYLFLGLAQCQKGQKAEGLKNLQKAKELGDSQADALIEKYSK